MSKLFKLVANCSEQTANQNTNIVAEVSKVARKRTSGLTVMSITLMHSCQLSFRADIGINTYMDHSKMGLGLICKFIAVSMYCNTQ